MNRAPRECCRVPRRPAPTPRALLLALLGVVLADFGCRTPPPPLRIGAQPWPGYEMLYLARDLGWLDPEVVRMVELPSGSASVRALAAGSLDGACLTLDEMLSGIARGLPLKAIAVLDVSDGGDVLMAGPGIATLAGLAGRRIGVEYSAVGAIMLHEVLKAGGLSAADVTVVYSAVDQHEDAFRAGTVDAVITYEPAAHRIAAMGARTLFSSADIPGGILDVLAVRADRLEPREQAVRAVVAAHLRALEAFRNRADATVPSVARRLRVDIADVPAVFAGVQLPDAEQNRQWFADDARRLQEAADHMAGIMRDSGLLKDAVPRTALFDGRFLPATGESR